MWRAGAVKLALQTVQLAKIDQLPAARDSTVVNVDPQEIGGALERPLGSSKWSARHVFWCQEGACAWRWSIPSTPPVNSQP